MLNCGMWEPVDAGQVVAAPAVEGDVHTFVPVTVENDRSDGDE